MLRCVRGLSLWLSLCLVLLGLAPLAHARPVQAPVWGEPLPLSAAATSAIASTPDIAVDAVGGLHVLWYTVRDRPAEEGGGLTDALVYMVRTGGVWSTEEPIYSQDRPPYSDTSSPLSSNATARNPAFALDGSVASARDGQLHFAVGDLQAQWYFGVPWGAVARVAALLPPVTLGAGTASTIASGDDGSLHVVLTAIPRGLEAAAQASGASCDACLEIVYRRSGDGGITWTRPENLSRLDGQDGGPELGTDEQGRVHLLWAHLGAAQPDEPSYLIYERSTDGGQSWAEPQRLGAPGEGSLQATLGVGPGGRLLAVYGGAATGSVFFQSSGDGGQSWSPPGLVPGVISPGLTTTSGRRFDLAVDGAGRFHLLMVGSLPANSGSEAQLLQLSWDGQSWSSPVPLASGGGEPGAPRIVVERGNLLHAVWSTSEADAERGERQTVWYSSAPIEAPELAPLPTFTPIVTVVATAAPTSTPLATPTLLPAESRQVDTIEGPPRWEGESLQVLVIALGPVLLLLGLVLWWATTRGRDRE